MSRSKRKVPVIGFTTAESEKTYKAAEHRRERRAVRQQVTAKLDEPAPAVYGNPWKGPKDGKMLFDRDKHPKLMRK